MKRIIEGTMKRSVLVAVSILLILLWGGMSAYTIQRDYLPSINNSALMVSIRAENYQAEQVKISITRPIEQAVRVVDGLQDIETTSFNGGLFISLNFPLNFDMERAEAQVSQVLERIELPSGVQKPVVTRLSTNALPIMRLSLVSSSDKINENTLRTSLQEKVVSDLKSVPGVKDVRMFGGGNNGYAVTLRTKDLEKTGLTVNDIKRSLEEKYWAGMQGNIANNQVSIPVQISGSGFSDETLKQMPIHSTDRKTVPLSAVADVSQAIVESQTISRTNGKPGVILDIMKTPSSNITDTADRVKSRIKDIPEIKNGEIQCSLLFDQGEQVDSSLKNLVKEGLLGCLFSMICVFFFFREVRSTLLIALSLPICLLATIGILKFMGISLNILTVSGLIVAMGRVVDDSIVILDNMDRRARNDKSGNSLELISQAVCEMIPAIVSSTATTIAVYVPIAIIGGMVSAAFSGFAWSVVIALVISLVVSILMVPTLYLLFRKGQSAATHNYLEPLTRKIFNWAFQRKLKIAAAVLILFLTASAGAAYLPVNFLPQANNIGQIGVQVELPEGTSLTQVDAEVKKMESAVQANPNTDSFSSSLGSSFTPQADDVFDQGGGWIQKTNVANVSITVKRGTDVESFMVDLQNQIKELSSKAVYTVTNQRIAGDDSQLKVNLTGSDQLTLDYTARTIRSKLQLVPGLAVQGAADDQEHATPYHITLNQEAVKNSGIEKGEILDRIALYMAEGTTVSIPTGLGTASVVIHSDLQKAAAASQNMFSLMGEEVFTAKSGQNVKLSELATLAPSANPSVIQEKNGRANASVTANITSSDVEKVAAQAKGVLENVSLPQGVKYSFAGASAQVNEMIYEMSAALSFSILLVLFIVSAVFRGWKAPLSVLICIPLALIGSVIGMFLFGKEWNLAALVGLMMLTGIVVTNGIVLVDRIERNLTHGLAPKEAILYGTLSRVRPVLMTAFTTILTLLPLSLSHSGDSIISQTLSIVVVGGMISSTFISLIIIPIAYGWMHTTATFPISPDNSI